MARLSKRQKDKIIALRTKYWPDIKEGDLWNRKENNGFTSIPRTMPIIMNIVDGLTKGAPAGKTLFALWARAFDEMYIAVTSAEEFAFESGFTGSKAKRQWQDRVKALEKLGLLKTKSGSRGAISSILLLNPHKAMRKLYDNKTAGLTEAQFNGLVERAHTVGADDLDPPSPPYAGYGIEGEVPF